MRAEGFDDDLLPKEDPPEGSVSREVFEYASRKEDAFERRSLLWTAALANGMETGELRGGLSFGWPMDYLFPYGFRHWAPLILTIGRVPVDTSGENRKFGIAYYALSLTAGGDVEQIGEVYLAAAANYRFPVVIVPAYFEHHHSHSLLPHPAGGLSTCWATDLNGAQGVLTAKHNFRGVKRGTRIPLGSLTGVVSAQAAHVVDAGFLQQAWAAAIAPAALATQPFPAMSTAVDISTAGGAIKNTAIESVVHTHWLTNNANFPINVLLDHSAAPGDSGGLVQDCGSGEGVALYTGQLTLPSGKVLGMSQHLLQAATILKLHLFL